MVRTDASETPRARPHERFGRVVNLTPDAVTEFARAAGDANPLHHDATYAAGTRFGRPIASGPHTSALLMACTATHFARTGAMLGLGFTFDFRRPVWADETVRIEWLVVGVRIRSTDPGAGDIVELRGRLQGSDGRTAVGAKGRVLLVDAL